MTPRVLPPTGPQILKREVSQWNPGSSPSCRSTSHTHCVNNTVTVSVVTSLKHWAAEETSSAPWRLNSPKDRSHGDSWTLTFSVEGGGAGTLPSGQLRPHVRILRVLRPGQDDCLREAAPTAAGWRHQSVCQQHKHTLLLLMLLLLLQVRSL